MPMAAKAMPTNQPGKSCRNNAGTEKLFAVEMKARGKRRALRYARRDGKEPHEYQQTQQQGVGRQQRGIASQGRDCCWR